MNEITPKVVDQWILDMKASVGDCHQSKNRRAFRHELVSLRGLFGHFVEFYDPEQFVNPIKKRHHKAVVLKKHNCEVNKNLTLEEFYKFLEELGKLNNGRLLQALAVVHMRHALRVSEVACIKWCDVNLNFRNPSESTLTVRRHAIYSRNKGNKPRIVPGFKNSSHTNSVKEFALHPESFKALKELFQIGAGDNYVFSNDGREILAYRQIAGPFDRAFKNAGLEVRGTHCLRHLGARIVFDQSNGDLEVAKQALHNRGEGSTRVYARRDKSALKKLTLAEWEKEKQGTQVSLGI